MQPYTESFYHKQREGSRRSAQLVLPLVLELIDCQRAIDVGCGVGTWLAVLKELGVKEITGVDGEYVKPNMLQIPPEDFHPHNLNQFFHENKKYDLVISLEVAEHLAADSADTFVETLTSLGPVVLFSAAVPYQVGTGHINPQWPEYWIERFQKKGFTVIDCLRPKIWHNPEVQYWYAQNMFLFVREDFLEKSPKLQQEKADNNSSYYSIVHPRMLEATMVVLDYATKPELMSLKKTTLALPLIIKNTVQRKLKRFTR